MIEQATNTPLLESGSLAKLKFVDIFAGCGGLSLGLVEAGLQGVFAVERSPLAFETLKHNLVQGVHHQFDWPDWLPVEAMTCERLLDDFSENLKGLRNVVDVIVGGPPCQGFSTAGKRDPTDPRNKMTEQYLRLVDIIRPKYIVIENVPGFDFPFEGELADDINKSCIPKTFPHLTYARYISQKLEDLNYDVSSGIVDSSHFGVPQQRLRYIMLCRKRDNTGTTTRDLVSDLLRMRTSFLRWKDLPINKRICTKEAIQDLEIEGRELSNNEDSGLKGFKEILYQEPESLTAYQKIMRYRSDGQSPNSLRLPRHKPKTVLQFQKIQAICRPGHSLSKKQRESLNIKKHSVSVLDPCKPAPTITTLPDDILHYSEPRILTARENARLQSFPDWFAFQGKYTTGGSIRKTEAPRYTQIGNAVPPLLSEAIGYVILADSTRDITD